MDCSILKIELAYDHCLSYSQTVRAVKQGEAERRVEWWNMRWRKHCCIQAASIFSEHISCSQFVTPWLSIRRLLGVCVLCISTSDFARIFAIHRGSCPVSHSACPTSKTDSLQEPNKTSRYGAGVMHPVNQRQCFSFRRFRLHSATPSSVACKCPKDAESANP